MARLVSLPLHKKAKTMRHYKTINNLFGWIVFTIAAFTYCSTIEPTASFWDCPEFISSAYLLEIGHPPGAPFFMLMGNLFAKFASDSTQVAKMINTMNALLSAGCILFLFWSITHFAKALLVKNTEEPSLLQTLAIMCSGLAGSLIYTWSDTFWFSAVEGEVYAFSSFFTALVFWLILKWEDNADSPRSDRWIILIAYLIGLSIGVHLLNLLCIPSIVLVFYYKRSKNPTAKGSLLMILISALLIALVLYGIVPGVAKVGGWFELLFVNELGMPYNTGLLVYILLLSISLIVALSITKRRYLHTSILCFTMILIGYSSYAVIFIRSCASPMMDENSPNNIFALASYLGREQYGEKPLLWGPTYCSEPELTTDKDGKLVYAIVKGGNVYRPKSKTSPNEKDEYIKVREQFDLKYPSNQCMLFPRIYSERHAALYEQWLGETHKHPVEYNIPGHMSETLQIPSMKDNLKFFFSYQMNHMYWRYFMWNFAGRQNDIQGNGEPEHGNWITGISFLDNHRLGNQSLLPSELRNNKGHNVFYCLPLILGLLGLLWQAFRDKKSVQQFWIVSFLFFMTGIAIVLYVNQTPSEPRERDYSYAGSFYAFAIWCGLGIAAIYDLAHKYLSLKMKTKVSTPVLSLLVIIPSLAVPLQMVSQTWDDHDRSNRYMCRDFGQNYLQSVPHDAIIFTNGDNETFPLWYNQDTEGVRTDVRVCNMQYLQTDWYIDQMKRPAFSGKGQSSPLPITWSHDQYQEGINEMVDVNPTIANGLTFKDMILQIMEQDPKLAHRLWGDDPFELKTAIHKFLLHEYEGLSLEEEQMVKSLPQCLPSDSLHITVDKDAVKKSGMKIIGDIPDKMEIDLTHKNRLSKAFVLVLDMIATTNFSRPIYFTLGIGPDSFGELYHHFVQEGLVWRITPFYIKENKKEGGLVDCICDTKKMYDNMMKKYKYGNTSLPSIYIDDTTGRMCIYHRRCFAKLATQLIAEGKHSLALQVLQRSEKEIPSYNIPHSFISHSLDMVQAFQQCGDEEKASKIYNQLLNNYNEYQQWETAKRK